MVVSARALALALAAFVLATRAHIPSHDNILRIQLWDAEGLSREAREPEPATTQQTLKHHNTIVNSDALYKDMLQEFGADFGRFTRHKVRHKRRRPRQSGTDLPWRFHTGSQMWNVKEYEYDVPWDAIKGDGSAVSGESESAVNKTGDASPSMALRQPEDDEQDEEDVKKQLPVVPKCCASGQNLTRTYEDGKLKWVCTRSALTFQPIFHQSNETHIFSYDSNVFETLVGNPCKYEWYRLNPHLSSQDEFYLLVNGSLFAPYNTPYLLGPKEYCMETFWNESYPAGLTLPLICFQSTENVTKSSTTLILYATGLLISVPFLLATVCVYTLIRELRDTHGKALACHCMCLAIAFCSLAVTQLAGHAFPSTACTIIAYIIQFSFVSCFFWLNVMCFDIYLNVRRYINTSVSRRSMRRRFAWYCAYAIILPLILLIVTITMQLHPAVPSQYLKPNFGVKACWFQTDQAALPYFYGPVAAILLLNLIIFFFTSRAFAIHYDKLKDVTPLDMAHSDSDDWVRLGTVLGSPIPPHEQRSASPPQTQVVNFNQKLKKYRKIFRTSCMLSAIMGVSWVLEVVSWVVGAGSEVVSVWSVFDLINALQGVVIFAIFVLQQPVRTYVKNSRIFSSCRRKTDGSEAAVVSERNSIIDCSTAMSGRKDYV